MLFAIFTKKRVMKKLLAFGLFAFALSALTLTSCNKYEEGSNFSFISKNSRMINNWEMTKLEQTSGIATADVTSTVDYIELDMNEDNTFEMRTALTILVQIISVETGTWAFNDDKTQVLLTLENGSVRTCNIIKLKKDELKISYTENAITNTIEMETK
jgi:hypothetical protein